MCFYLGGEGGGRDPGEGGGVVLHQTMDWTTALEDPLPPESAEKALLGQSLKMRGVCDKAPLIYVPPPNSRILF